MIDYALLNAIPPDCSYDEWLKVGMALKHEGADCSVWDDWSRGGTKYKSGECERKWRSFKRNDVTGGTLYHIATTYGYAPEKDTRTYDIHNLLLDEVIVDPSFIRIESIPKVPDKYNPKGDMLEYFTTLFQPDDFVGYCTEFYFDKDDKTAEAQTPIFHYIIVKAHPKRLISNINYLNCFTDGRDLPDINFFIKKCLESVEFVYGINPSSLKMSSKEFIEKCNDSNQRLSNLK